MNFLPIDRPKSYEQYQIELYHFLENGKKWTKKAKHTATITQ